MEATTNFDDIRQILQEIALTRKELSQSQKETDRITKQNAKLIGDIGNKFGRFTEGMAFPSMEKVLRFVVRDDNDHHELQNGVRPRYPGN